MKTIRSILPGLVCSTLLTLFAVLDAPVAAGVIQLHAGQSVSK